MRSWRRRRSPPHEAATPHAEEGAVRRVALLAGVERLACGGGLVLLALLPFHLVLKEHASMLPLHLATWWKDGLALAVGGGWVAVMATGALCGAGAIAEGVLGRALFPSQDHLRQFGYAEIYVFRTHIVRPYLTFDHPTGLGTYLALALLALTAYLAAHGG